MHENIIIPQLKLTKLGSILSDPIYNMLYSSKKVLILIRRMLTNVCWHCMINHANTGNWYYYVGWSIYWEINSIDVDLICTLQPCKHHKMAWMPMSSGHACPYAHGQNEALGPESEVLQVSLNIDWYVRRLSQVRHYNWSNVTTVAIIP